MKKYQYFLTILYLLIGLEIISQPDSLITSIQDLCWSPDGEYIYFSAMKTKPDYSDYKPEKWKIYRYGIQDKSVTMVFDSSFNVALSRNGKNIAVGKITNGNRDIFITDETGKKTEVIASHLSEDFAPAWSPDGKKILFNSKRDGKVQIYVVNIDNTGLKRLTFNEIASSYNPQWSPDGRKIIYYLEKGDGKDQLYIMNSDGSDAFNITNDSFNNYYPAFLSDTQIIYTQNNNIYTINTGGYNKKQMLKEESFFARFSADNSTLAFIDQNELCIKVVSSKRKVIAKIIVK